MLRPKPRPKTQSLVQVTYGGLFWEMFRQYRSRALTVHSFNRYPSIVRIRTSLRRLSKELEMIRPNGSAAKGTGKLAKDDPLAWKELPNWRAFFLDQTYGEDQAERQPGLLIVRPSSEGWQFTLKEPQVCLMLRFIARTWDEGLLLGEAFLGDPHAPWESDPYEAAKRGRSRRKGG